MSSAIKTVLAQKRSGVPDHRPAPIDPFIGYWLSAIGYSRSAIRAARRSFAAILLFFFVALSQSQDTPLTL
jgi:hypothetical protein